jgi:hypothetical protein
VVSFMVVAAAAKTTRGNTSTSKRGIGGSKRQRQ